MHYKITNVGFYDAMSVKAVDYIMNQTKITTIFCEGGLGKKIIQMKKDGLSGSLVNLVVYDDIEADLTSAA
jgi:long-subunit acyl-CoA synthetase (AMP-forming)